MDASSTEQDPMQVLVIKAKFQNPYKDGNFLTISENTASRKCLSRRPGCCGLSVMPYGPFGICHIQDYSDKQ